jgi:hypothetical protein
VLHYPTGSPLIEGEMKGGRRGRKRRVGGLKKEEGDESPLQFGSRFVPVSL